MVGKHWINPGSLLWRVCIRGVHGLDFGFFGSGLLLPSAESGVTFFLRQLDPGWIWILFLLKKCYWMFVWLILKTGVKQESDCLFLVNTGPGAVLDSKFEKQDWIRAQKLQSPNTSSVHVLLNRKRMRKENLVNKTKPKKNWASSKIDHWLRANKLSLNYNKTTFMLLTSRKHNPASFKVIINNHNIFPEDDLKYLGVLLDNKLSWKPHVQKVKTQLSRACGIRSKLKHYATLLVLKVAYNSSLP